MNKSMGGRPEVRLRTNQSLIPLNGAQYEPLRQFPLKIAATSLAQGLKKRLLPFFQKASKAHDAAGGGQERLCTEVDRHRAEGGSRDHPEHPVMVVGLSFSASSP